MQAVEPDEQALDTQRGWRIPFSNLQIILILLIVVGGSLIVNFRQRITEGQQKLAQQEALEAEIEALIAEQEALEAAKVYYGSPAFVEAWAHDQGKMVRDGEILVIPLYERPEQPSESAPTVQTAVPSSKWQIWWALFFDGPPPFGQTDN